MWETIKSTYSEDQANNKWLSLPFDVHTTLFLDRTLQ